jgi:hypothetical protein
MALIPLTMSRFSIAALSESVLDRFVPLNRALRIHIHLGYTMVLIVFLDTAFFFTFFGILCADGEQAYCDKFTSEIMITGYGILVILLIIAGTSYFRHQIPYEIFYAVHHIIFLMYIIVVVHTFDMAQRKGQHSRSQTFKWFSSTLLYYLCDRAAMHLNHKYQTRLVSSSAVTGTNGSRMLIIKLKRPVLFNSKPGQYAFLRLTELDLHWHPFSIASGPDSSCLEFYIEVFTDKSWTGKLWKMLKADGDTNGSNLREFDLEVMGPYGTSLANTNSYSHALAVGSGTGKYNVVLSRCKLHVAIECSPIDTLFTGIVPMLSLFKQHVHQLLRLDPANHFLDLERHQRKIRQIEKAEEPRKASLAKKVAASCRARRTPDDRPSKSKRDSVVQSIRNRIAIHESVQEMEGSDRQLVRLSMQAMRSAARRATRSIYGVVLLTIMPVLGISLIALTISWNTIDVELYGGMVEALMILTAVFQLSFAVVACCVWDASQFAAFIDTAFCLIMPFADWYWFGHYEQNGVLSPSDITTYSLLMGYLTARAWSMTVKPRHRSWRTADGSCSGLTTLERLEMVWVTRSASLVSEILPEINTIWDQLVSVWGAENAQAVCRIQIFVTDTDQRAVALLKQELLHQSLGQGTCDSIRFERPDFAEIIENHTLDMITTRRNSYSVLAFCGSPILAGNLHHLKINNDMVAAVTGNKRHQMEFVSESYGGSKGGKKKASNATNSAESADRQDVLQGEHLLGGGSDTDTDTSPDPGEVVGGKPTRLTTREVTTYGRTSPSSSMESSVDVPMHFSHVRVAPTRN